MFGHVIIGVDGRPNGRDAIALGLQLVDPDGRITLVHVRVGESTPQRGSNLEFDRVEREDSEELLARERTEAQVNAELRSIADESVSSGLHRLAEELHADLLVVGSCHRRRAGRALLTDNARATLNGAPCPVAIAPLGYVEAVRPLRRVGVAYDATPQSAVALTLARELAGREDADVHARQVLPSPATPFVSESPAVYVDTYERELRAEGRKLDLPPGVDGEVVIGRVADELCAFSGQIDVLVVGSRDQGPMRRALLGSTSALLAHRAKCPLIVVPRGRLAPHEALAGTSPIGQPDQD